MAKRFRRKRIHSFFHGSFFQLKNVDFPQYSLGHAKLGKSGFLKFLVIWWENGHVKVGMKWLSVNSSDFRFNICKVGGACYILGHNNC